MDQWIEDGNGWCDQPGRRRSGEVDFGSRWQPIDGPEWPLYRVSWIVNTGELYAIEERLQEERRRLCVLGIITDRETVERLMDGWCEPDFRIGPFCKGHAPVVPFDVDIVWGLKR
jgi:hypothetical protein